MRVLVTGGSGFLGSFVVERLLQRGHEVKIFDARKPQWTPEVEWLEQDIADADGVQDCIDQSRPEAIVHMAGLLGTTETFDHPAETVRTNVIGTINVLQACRRRPESRYVGVQTGTPWLSPYAISKQAATNFARGYHQAFGIPVTILKIFNAYGPRQDGTGPVNKIVPRFAVNALRGRPLPIFGDGQQVIDLVYAESCAECYVRAIESAPGGGEVIEVGSGKPISVLEVAGRILDIVGGGDLEFLPRRLGEGREYPVADTTMAGELLGYAPQASLDRLPETVEWYARNVVQESPARGR
jgi:UDP-glucose 4-epimerase